MRQCANSILRDSTCGCLSTCATKTGEEIEANISFKTLFQCYKKPRKVCQTLVTTKPKVVTEQASEIRNLSILLNIENTYLYALYYRYLKRCADILP